MNLFARVLLALVIAWLGCGPGDESPAPTEDAPAERGTGPAEPGASPVIWPPVGPEDEVRDYAADPLAENYYVILDGSGSMTSQECARGGSRAAAAKQALAEFARLVPPNAHLGLLAFDNSGVTERLPLGVQDRGAFIAAVAAVGADSDTPLASAIRRGYEALMRQARLQRGYGVYNLVIVTDGIPSQGEDPTDVVDRILSESPVVIHTIGFCIGSDHTLNQQGRTLYRSATNPEELRAGLSEVLAEAPSFDVANF